MNLPPGNSKSYPGFSSEIPAVFVSLEEARNSLDYQWNLCNQKAIDFENVRKLESGDKLHEHRALWDSDRQYYKHQCNRWSTVFQAFLNANVQRMDSKAMQGRVLEP